MKKAATIVVADGFDLCRRLKNDRVTRFIPVVLVTSLGVREGCIESINAGADDLLTEPVDAHSSVSNDSPTISIPPTCRVAVGVWTRSPSMPDPGPCAGMPG